MTSTNINKFVKSNINLKPWMLSKNTNQIVNSYIQKIYKQMPMSFNKDNKSVKVASPRTENMGPLRTFKSQEPQKPVSIITPKVKSNKKSLTKLNRSGNNLLNTLKVSNNNNQQMASKFAGVIPNSSKRLLKSPNYKIYKSRRFGSSASSSRSSILRRHDDRKRAKPSYPSQISYLIRSFHTGQFEPSYARYLMPARNQQLEASLGSIPDAIKFSSNIQNDLMKIDNFTKNKLLGNKKSQFKLNEHKRFDVWNHPPSLSKFRLQSPKDSAIKNVSLAAERHMRRSRLLPEHRDYARINVLKTTQLKHTKTPNELFTAEHDRNKTELHEKHRRNRMKKLGLIETQTEPETEHEDKRKNSKVAVKVNEKQSETIETSCRRNEETVKATKVAVKVNEKQSETSCRARNQLKQLTKTSSKLKNQSDSKQKSNHSLKPTVNMDKKVVPKKENSTPSTDTDLKFKTPLNNSLTNQIITSTSSSTLSRTHSLIAPIAAARAQMPQRNSYRTYRYNCNDFFGSRKY